MRMIDDLVSSGIIYGDYVFPWARLHTKEGKLTKSGGHLPKVSPWGDEFLKHWDELNRLSTARDHHHSEIEYDLHREERGNPLTT